MPRPAVAQWIGIHKAFGGTRAVNGVSLDVRQGEVLALVGENGAGKSTLASILLGLVKPDSGTMAFAGQPHAPASPAAAMARGLGMVHQHFTLFDEMTVLDNIIYGAEPTTRAGIVDRAAARQRVAALAAEHGLAVDPDVPAGMLPVGERQRTEILKMLFRGADLLVLDEPTAVLAPAERDGLFRLFADLRARGRSVVFITHKLDEVMAVADRVAVMRDGALVGVVEVAATEPRQLAAMMVGRDFDQDVLRAKSAPGQPLLEITDLVVESRPGLAPLRGVSLAVRAGEIVGVAGVARNGQEALVAGLAGLERPASGSIRAGGQEVTFASIAQRRAAGIAVVPADRQDAGLAPAATIVDNACAGAHDAEPLARHGWLRREAMVERARVLIEGFDVRGAVPGNPAASLSGGNQQKLVLGRELSRGAQVLVVDQPTWGVDIGALEAIYARLDRARDAGAAILLVSADLNEIMRLADRVVVLRDGQVAGMLAGDEVADERRLGALMAGVEVLA